MEVTSNVTERVDRGIKLRLYRARPPTKPSPFDAPWAARALRGTPCGLGTPSDGRVPVSGGGPTPTSDVLLVEPSRHFSRQRDPFADRVRDGMANTLDTPLVNSGDRDDANNYVSIDDFRAGASPWMSSTVLVQRWNAAHPEATATLHGDSATPAPASNANAFVDCGMTRVFAALQLIGGGFEVIVAGGALLAPEPTGVTKVLGAVVMLHGVDTLQASARTILSCDRAATMTQQGASSLARFAGASPATAETIGVVTDVGIGVGGSFAVGALTRVAPGAGSQLVHLTRAESAAAIRASDTLGLGRSTIYAGPEALSRARGWSILARTGLRPSQATEVILLPSAANRAFVMVQPMGIFSTWQRLNGTVFSAGTGMFNLSTGAFTRTGLAMNQLVIYSTDAAVMATVRAVPGALDISFPE
jgi:hypothetical protein